MSCNRLAATYDLAIIIVHYDALSVVLKLGCLHCGMNVGPYPTLDNTTHLRHVEVVHKHHHVFAGRGSIDTPMLLLQPAINNVLRSIIPHSPSNLHTKLHMYLLVGELRHATPVEG